jgi:spore germination cell wall hydrolase CwlJ-like protein
MAIGGKGALVVGLGLGAGLLLAMTTKANAASTAIPKGKKGKGLRYAKETSNPEDAEALARVIASEAGGEPRDIQIAVAHATRNAARKLGTSVTSLVKTPGNTYGPQSRGSYASTARAPNAAHRTLANQVLSNAVADNTQGAVQYDSPKAQRALLAKKAKGYTKTPEQVAADRRKAGKRLVLLPGIPEDRFRMWA